MSQPEICFYIAGPMTGYPEHNFPAFDAAQAHLEQLGFACINPANLERSIPVPEHEPWDRTFAKHCIRRDLIAIIDQCHALYLLRGWKKSRGAAVETSLARYSNMPMIEEGHLTREYVQYLLNRVLTQHPEDVHQQAVLEGIYIKLLS